jgi:serine/threonine protein kinase
VPQAALLTDKDFAKRFAREVQSLVRLGHPHIVRVLDAGVHDGLPFAVLQHLSGGNLRNRQARGDGRSALSQFAELGTWLPQVATALDYMHRQGYVHRDVKPDNILFDAEGNAYVSDFGITKALAGGNQDSLLSLTTAGQIAGTAQYLAPEQIVGKPFDGRADQYALAVTVFEALTGQVPFDGPTLTAIFEKQKQRPPRLDQRLPEIPAKAALAVQQALLADPVKRFPTCEAFAAAVLAGRTGLTSIPSAARPAASAPAPPAENEQTMVETTTVYCPHCRQKVGVRAILQGKKAQCLHCKNSFQVPLLAQVAATKLLDKPATSTHRARSSGWLKLVGCAAFLLTLLAGASVAGFVFFDDIKKWWEEMVR